MYIALIAILVLAILALLVLLLHRYQLSMAQSNADKNSPLPPLEGSSVSRDLPDSSTEDESSVAVSLSNSRSNTYIDIDSHEADDGSEEILDIENLDTANLKNDFLDEIYELDGVSGNESAKDQGKKKTGRDHRNDVDQGDLSDSINPDTPSITKLRLDDSAIDKTLIEVREPDHPYADTDEDETITELDATDNRRHAEDATTESNESETSTVVTEVIEPGVTGDERSVATRPEIGDVPAFLSLSAEGDEEDPPLDYGEIGTNDNWLERVAQLKKDDQMTEALGVCQSEFPLWSAYQQASLIHRARIKRLIKEELDHTEELEQLYFIAAQASFLHDHVPGLPNLSLALLKTLDLKKIDQLEMPYSEIGYTELRLIKKTDIKLLLGHWGRPNAHIKPRKLLSEAWLELTSAQQTTLF